MKPIKHFIIGGIVIIVLAFLIKITAIQAIIILLTNIFIDIDHVLGVWINKRKVIFNLKYLYNGCRTLPEGPWTFLHSIEGILCIALLSVIFNFYLILIGVLIHCATDYISKPNRLKSRFYFSYIFANTLKTESFK